MEFYSAMRNKEILPFTTTWMDGEDIMLSEILQRKANTVRYHLHVKSKKAKLRNRVEWWFIELGWEKKRDVG